MTKQAKRASDEAVLAATGKNWQTWFGILNQNGAAEKTHKEIAAWLISAGWLAESQAWWAQGITVAYEYEIGRRVLGETQDAGFNMGIQRTFPLSAEKIWLFLTSEKGLPLWLGGVSSNFSLEKGSAYETANGTRGEIRSVEPAQRLRLTWQPPDWQQKSTLQLYLLQKGENTSLRFHHEGLKDSAQREKMKAHWQAVLNDLGEAFERL